MPTHLSCSCALSVHCPSRSLGRKGAKPAPISPLSHNRLRVAEILFSLPIATRTDWARVTSKVPSLWAASRNYQMTILKPRSRMISVRLSEEEYSALRRLCLVSGARSVSDLAREAMHAFLRGPGRGDLPPISANDVNTQMKSLDQKIEHLAAEFSSFRTVSGR